MSSDEQYSADMLKAAPAQLISNDSPISNWRQ
uniref:Uncharacterized protein n=1 Tax=Anguilla anguilla TaxID=7936 RepID=A0A0E9RMN5_ANGAN